MTLDEAIEYEQMLHRKYFLPFDKVLESKAEYYLKITEETGKEYKKLLEEIEILNNLREYVVLLESLVQQQLHQQHNLAKTIEHLRNQWTAEIEYNRETNQILKMCINLANAKKSSRS